MLVYEKLQIQEVIYTFEEKYSKYGVEKFLDSKGIPYKYQSKTNSGDVELLLSKDRVLLRSYGSSSGDVVCMITNPLPRDILDSCPPKW